MTPLARYSAPSLMWKTESNARPATTTNRPTPSAIAVEVNATRQRVRESAPSVSIRNASRIFGGPTTATRMLNASTNFMAAMIRRRARRRASPHAAG